MWCRFLWLLLELIMYVCVIDDRSETDLRGACQADIKGRMTVVYAT